jgi:hypothetical protein
MKRKKHSLVPPVAVVRQRNKQEGAHMPVILLWGIPTLIVIGGGAYWIAHLH